MNRLSLNHWKQTEGNIMSPKFIIMAIKSNGATMQCFTWCKDMESGIKRAWADAKVHGVSLHTVWAVPV
jgi:hypothetical protein